VKKNHWENFYAKNMISKRSSFAQFCLKFLKKDKSILDIGSGSGRDTFFFHKNKLNSVGVDFSKTAVNKCNQICLEEKNIKFLCKNIIHLNFKKKFDYIYCRFFIHAINKKEEQKLLHSLKKITKKNTILFFEFRTINDPMLKKGEKISKYERLYGHYRRFIDPIDFKNNLTKFLNFKILYNEESRNLSKFKDDNPSLQRLIVKRI